MKPILFSKPHLDPQEAELQALGASLLRWNSIAKLIALTAMVLSAWLTTKGLFDATIEANAANTEGMVTSAMTAAMAAVVIGGGTMLLFGLPMHAGKAQRGHVIGLTLAITPLVFCVSTYNAIIATSAQRSMIFDMPIKHTCCGITGNTFQFSQYCSGLRAVFTRLIYCATQRAANRADTTACGCICRIDCSSSTRATEQATVLLTMRQCAKRRLPE